MGAFNLHNPPLGPALSLSSRRDIIDGLQDDFLPASPSSSLSLSPSLSPLSALSPFPFFCHCPPSADSLILPPLPEPTRCPHSVITPPTTSATLTPILTPTNTLTLTPTTTATITADAGAVAVALRRGYRHAPANMNFTVAGALAPLPATPPPLRAPSKPRPDMRLPCFHALGIASPHPDRFAALDVAAGGGALLENRFVRPGSMNDNDNDRDRDNDHDSDSDNLNPSHDHHTTATTFPARDAHHLNVTHLLDTLHIDLLSPPPPPPLLYPSDTTKSSTASGQSTVASPPRPPHPSATPPPPFPHDVAALTPPAEEGDGAWSPPLAHTPLLPPHPPPPPHHVPPTDSPASTDPEQSASSATAHLLPHAIRPIAPPSAPVQSTASSVARLWINGALEVLLGNLRSPAVPINPLRVLSHALPSPSTTGHVFPSIIDAIHTSVPGQPTVWINVFHAIQGRFNLADLPSSPPSTPGPAIGGDDYFTQKVFDTAVPISDYQQDLSSLPRSPRPIVPPCSIDVSIVERYIPPSTAHEFRNMFNLAGPSILVDRLVELSPKNGSLIFVYPTRAGADTFMKDYLGPLLDPQLRSLVVINGLSSNLSWSLGHMAAIEHLLTYEQMHQSMATLCEKLSQQGAAIEPFYQSPASFSLVHASRQEVLLDREAWSRDWWAKQEKQRIRDMMTRYAHDAQRQSSNEYVERAHTPTELVQQLLEGVTKKSTYPSGQKPKQGIEISVFIIKRSS